MSGILIAGMFLGRFLTQAGMDRTLTDLTAQLASRDVQISLLHEETKRSFPQQQKLDDLREQHAQLSRLLDAMEKEVALQHELIQRELRRSATDRHVCLSELHAIATEQRLLSPEDVIGFAERMFNTRAEILEALIDGRAWSIGDENAVPFPAFDTHDIAVDKLAKAVRPERRDASEKSMPSHAGQHPNAGAFFTLPRRPTGYTFVSPRQASRVAVDSAGLRFSDGSPPGAGPILR